MAFTTCLFVLWICTITGAKEFQIGGTIKLPCNVPSTFTEFSWTKSATLLAKYDVSGSSFVSNDGRVDVITPEKAGKLGELTIKDITRHDSGNYTCTALVRNGPLKETSFTVTVVELTSTKSSTSGMTTSVKEIGPTTDMDFRNTAATSSFRLKMLLCCGSFLLNYILCYYHEH